MKRMVKNGDQVDISKNGNASVAGNLKVGGTIIANGEIRGGDVSASKFYLGTEEMPLVKANPASEATETLEKVKIGNVAYNVGGGASNERELSLTIPYASGDESTGKKIYVDEQTWNKIKNCYFETIKFYFNDGNPMGVFHVFYFRNGTGSSGINSKQYACISYFGGTYTTNDWYGKNQFNPDKAKINCSSDSNGKYLSITGYSEPIPVLYEANFDARYKLADKPTQDGTYVLKATVSGGAVTYTWEQQV